MEASSGEKEKEAIDKNYKNPCYYLEVVARAVLKCLGLDSPPTPSTTHEEDDHPASPTQQRDSNIITDHVAAISSTRVYAMLRRSPARPGVSSGRDPQGN